MKKIVAIPPYSYNDNSNFKIAPFEAWKELGGNYKKKRSLEKYYESLSYHIDFPTIYQKSKEARLRFVEGACVRFDTFPDYITHEIIPLIWDCWPYLWEQMGRFLKKHDIKTAFFTSSQTAEYFRKLFPEKKIYYLPEAIDVELYKEGKVLKERRCDYLEFGRVCNFVNSSLLPDTLNILSSKNENGALKTREMLIDALADSKITICLPRSVNQPEIASGIETLTQRYWECMLSRVLIIGKAPKELIDIIGYDPVINIDKDNFGNQLQDILNNIETYQMLVDKNRVMAIQHGDWKKRMLQLRCHLEECGYQL